MMFLDPLHLIHNGGLLLIGLIIFAESGMLVGFFFPGDTLLISAGVFASQGKLSLAAIIIVAGLAAIVGDNTGYYIGKFIGPRLFKKKDGVLFRQEYIDKTQIFFERFGSKAMLLAHFVPVVRTFAPVVAGVGEMHHAKFSLFDAIGDIAWAISVTLLGYYVGSKIPGLDHYILLLVAAAVILSFGPIVYHLIVRRHKKRIP